MQENDNLIFTIKGILYLQNTLLNKKNFKHVLTGAFTQDPIENFFGYLRSHGVRNTNLDVQHFSSSSKTNL